ncbi:hypothetical protein HCTV5_117 [Halovirus HCTV-5]|uniref:hypothetical protein n=1 Tax=Halovirus HCTV-5 TaxID=1273748 RepID=UPI00033483AC|nr:hypothetical protein M200_gp058 [Halovirus HCTV-5]AGM11776.1 hypothetical protein HCTV5_117 [Halovirus HCTV-5]
MKRSPDHRASMTTCPNCDSEVDGTTQKNLKGRPSSKSRPQECPECGHELEKSLGRNNPSLLNK